MTEMKDSEIIAAAQDLIRDPHAWVKGYWCLPKGQERVDGCRIDEVDYKRDRYCLEGAIARALGLYERRMGLPLNFTSEERKIVHARKRRLFHEVKDLLPDIVGKQKAIKYDSLNDFNDAGSATHEDAMALLDKARAKFEEEGR